MVRSIVVIALALVCGAAAAIGVSKAVSRQDEETPVVEVATQPVLVATQRIGRGEVIAGDLIREVDWPVHLLPDQVIGSPDNAIGRVALSTIMPGEPLFDGKLTEDSGEGFIASIIKPGMRAYTIQTRGPSATVAGFVRPKDRVDVLVNLRGSTNDETGGGSTTTLLQSVEILAIDQMLAPDADPLEMLEMWTKGDSLTSVTLQVTPAEASLLALGQSYGELSLALRRFGDEQEVETVPATIRDIRYLELAGQIAASEGPVDPDAAPGESGTDVTRSLTSSARDAAPRTTIETLRGNVRGRYELTERP